ncbi:unnamed protein product [Rotaria sordida]|uniref:Uncharacterized protein n=1 Tax=Rotaria sordida TaxID=392033 RepID=A0A814UYE6_9BILA|nr:unnamed protein product [Rotaria sordida]
MTFLIYVLKFSILIHISASSYTYGIIHNASIKIPFDIPDNLGHELQVQRCDQCLCDAFSNPKVVLLTCTENGSMNFTCQFYYFMPKRDEIQYPRNDTKIYLIQNITFEEKDDCCNTTYLIEKINAALNFKKAVFNEHLRFLVRGDNNMIVSTSKNKLIKFDRSKLEIVDVSSIPDSSTVGYYDKYYYLGKDNTIRVYNEALISKITEFSVGNGLTTIRFLNDKEMLVGTASSGGFICEKQQEIFDRCISTPVVPAIGQLHAFGIVDENTFYAGWYANNENLRLYTKDQNNSWKENTSGTITQNEATSDIVIDDCKRIWAVIPEENKIFIYDQNKTHPHKITFDSKIFNLFILDNYTFVTSHETKPGLNLIQPSLNCRKPR